MPQQTTDYIEGAIEFRAPGLLKDSTPTFVDGRLLPVRLPVSRVSAVSTNTVRFLPLNGYDRRTTFEEGAGFLARHPHADRDVLWSNYLYKNNIAGLFIFNTMDAQPWDYRTMDSIFESIPVWQYARKPSALGSAFLFPLDKKYSGPGTENLPKVGFDQVPFRDKLPKVFWRGRVRGTCYRDGGMRWLNSDMRAALNTAKVLGDIDACKESLREFLRVRVVDNLIDSPIADVAFSHWPEGGPWRASNNFKGWFKSRVSKTSQSRFRYLLALEGNDIPSGLYWSLASNSVVLIPQRHWETAMDFGFQAWLHYIPTGDSAEEIEQTVDTCEADLDMCEDIISNAHKFIDRLTDVNLRDTIDFEVATRYARQFREVFSRGQRSLYV